MTPATPDAYIAAITILLALLGATYALLSRKGGRG